MVRRPEKYRNLQWRKGNNVELAESIELKNKIKFKDGIASSFELREAQNQLYSIQNEYLEATLKLIENKINLEILLNKS